MNFRVKHVEFVFKANIGEERISMLECEFHQAMKVYASNTVITEVKAIELPNNKTKIITLQKMISLNTFNNVMRATINELKAISPFIAEIAEINYDNEYKIIRVNVI